MRQRALCAGLIAVVSAGFLSGCKHSCTEPSYPHDPLLVSKKPVEGTITEEGPVLMAEAEPTRPHGPFAFLFRKKAPVDSTVVSAPPPLPGAPAPAATTAPTFTTIPNATGGAVVATPASRSNAAAPDAATQPIRQVAGTYGHASDYSWLQGILDRHYTGSYNLRYCDSTKDDPFGGKVRLDSDPRLANFHEGDVVLIEGGLVHEDSTGKSGWKHFPRYYVKDIRLIQKK